MVKKSEASPTTMKTYFFSALVGISILLGISGCKGSNGTEIQRLTSPDNLVDAVLVDFTGGALSSFKCGVYIVPKGQTWNEKECVAWINKVSQLWISWRGPCFLEIHYKQGIVSTFQSMWVSRDIYNFKYRVESRLFPESEWTIDIVEGTTYHKATPSTKSDKKMKYLFPETMLAKEQEHP